MYAHASIMILAFLVFYPLGAVLVRFVGKWYIHAAVQMLGFIGMWAGFATGYVLAKRDGEVSRYSTMIIIVAVS